MSKKKKDLRPRGAATDNPFAGLGSLLGDLPDAPEGATDTPESDSLDLPAGLTDREKKQIPLRVYLDRKQRRGKVATIVGGAPMAIGEEGIDLDRLAKDLKKQCSTGGAVKDGEIILQGDCRDKVVELLKGMGFTGVKKAGG